MNTLMRGLLAATLSASVLSIAAPALAEPAAPGAERVRVPVADAIEQLTVQTEDRTGYKRTSFKHWIDADRDGCNTRQEVLIQEAVEKPAVGKGCSLTGGRWHSYYDGQDTSDPRSLDIDHMVPLAEAWDSSASNWDAKQREAYANDLGSERSLVAVTAKHNRAKGDKDPTDWWVPSADASCQYLSDWVATKTRWKLTIDQAEKQALTDRAAQCPDTRIDTELAH
ncbi:HNH endonuclease family protein (plasmid) [Streptomyces sp. NBC_01795]|uniref:HNH endonuclease family protein n=1 Tax=unclassified Streptomyces TaxID=2593676 RepID=UPI002DDA3B1D|nr:MULTISPECIES: HNH endonuclease family protein [unclassified Streptomyces]WSA97573.1 HNH endonuclease family protein [Streptomyces sp. NBC_01795]WSB82179.1 HNH endonuclease family protein [Streptomyces sp. NBC_01775]WSS18150.1 HNH endonuclease family protein [Streptomyces sp. NBC_01186]